MVHQRVRIRFSKQGDLRLISHRDLARTLDRLLRRCGLTLRMSEGFHPKPRINFPSALALGVEGLDEVVEVDLAEPMAPDQLAAALSAQAPQGLTFGRVEIVPPDGRSAQAKLVCYWVDVPLEEMDRLNVEIARLMKKESHLIHRAGREAAIDLRSTLKDLRVEGGCLHMTLRVAREAAARPRDVLELLGLIHEGQPDPPVARTAVELWS